MPIQFRDLARDTKDGKVADDAGQVIKFKFRFGLVTPRLVKDFLALDDERIRAMSADEASEALMAVSAHVAQLVTWWDVLDGPEMFPLTPDRLASDIPLALQLRILSECIREMRPGEATAPGASQNGHASGAGSSRTARSKATRTGTP